MVDSSPETRQNSTLIAKGSFRNYRGELKFAA
jgi:hypothetical protein